MPSLANKSRATETDMRDRRRLRSFLRGVAPHTPMLRAPKCTLLDQGRENRAIVFSPAPFLFASFAAQSVPDCTIPSITRLVFPYFFIEHEDGAPLRFNRLALLPLEAAKGPDVRV